MLPFAAARCPGDDKRTTPVIIEYRETPRKRGEIQFDLFPLHVARVQVRLAIKLSEEQLTVLWIEQVRALGSSVPAQPKSV